MSVATGCNSLLISPTVSPTVKHLFKGFDVTIFAYGVTGTGKTHTMRGGKSLQDRGVIPRLLSSIYRRARKVEKDSAGESSVQVSMSYYEIYNEKSSICSRRPRSAQPPAYLSEITRRERRSWSA